jgi:hypothetical protein
MNAVVKKFLLKDYLIRETEGIFNRIWNICKAEVWMFYERVIETFYSMIFKVEEIEREIRFI